ncbi:MAG: AIR synthase family protein, partial [Desulfobacterales bacterium]|nr:AIR synthase family protein [Desulfobacterales bacterium]
QVSDRIVLGSGIGEAATVIDMDGSRYLIAKTDPITHATAEIGYYAVNINANDIAAMGGVPLWFLATILVPEHTEQKELERIFSQISGSCKALGIIYCGGHTEVTSSVTKPVVVGQMLGEVEKTGLKPTAGAKKGDDLIMTKWAAIEATSIIANEHGQSLKTHFSDELVTRAQQYLYDPGISVTLDSRIVSRYPEIHALHDPTEGGIATGIYEMAYASHLGMEVYHDRIPISCETAALCQFYNIDPLGTFASGSLLIASAPDVSGEVIGKLNEHGIKATCIGKFMDPADGIRLIKQAQTIPLPIYQQDELSKIFG